MNKKRLSILALILCLVVAFTATMLVACNPDGSGDGDSSAIEATEGLLISNSDFKVISTSGDWPRSITGWTGGKHYSSSTIPGDIIGGAVSLEQAIYEANRKFWNDDGSANADGLVLYDQLKSHFSSEEGAVNNVLMAYMPTKDKITDDEDYGPTAYGYTSQNFTLEKGCYYKLTVDVLTYNIAGTDEDGNVPGASIYVGSEGYAEFTGIDTKGVWQTYEIYFESAPTKDSSLSLRLSLGKYSSYYSDGLTTGYAFFDNVNLEKLEDVEGGDTARQQYEKKADEELAGTNPYLQTVTLKVPNGRFDFGSTSIGTSAPSNWSVVTGTNAPTSYRFDGIIDAAKFAENYTKYAGTYYLGDGQTHTPASMLEAYADKIGQNLILGSNVYMLSQQMMTAQGVKTSKQITIEKNKFYAISVNVFTAGIYGEGVTLTLSGDGKDISIKGISQNKVDGTVLFSENSEREPASTGSWKTYTFYIQGNQYRDMSYNMTFWLGTGSAADNTEVTYDHYSSTSASAVKRTTYKANGTFSTGWAFFDNLMLTEYADQGEFDQASKDAQSGYEIIAKDDDTSIKVDLTTENLFKVAGDSGISGDFSSYTQLNGFDKGTLGTPKGFTQALGENPPAVGEDYMTAGVVPLTDEEFFKAFGIDAPLTPYELGADPKGLMMRATQNTYYAFETEKFNIKANHFYRISMWVKTDAVKSTSGVYVYLMQPAEEEGKDPTVLSSFTAINTEDYDDYTNDWVELSFVIRGSAEEAKDLYLKVAFGDSNAYNSDTLARGTAYVCNMSMTAITYSDFTGTSSGTYVKTVNLATSKSGSFTNGAFNDVDYSEMGDEAWTAGDGTLQDSTKPGIPSNWSISDTTLADNDNFVGGIVKLDTKEEGGWQASNQINTLFPDDANFFVDGAVGAPNMLVLAGKGEAFSAGYLSDNFKLSASTNYAISLWAKAKADTEAGTKAMIYLQGEASGSELGGQTRYFNVIADDQWHQYTFNIQVGLTGVSLKLGLWLGENADITGGMNADGTAKAEADLKSSGIVVFDSVTQHTLTDKEFNDSVSDENYNRKITFFTDSFDSMDGATSDENLTTPDGWTGTVGTDQDKDNTNSGVLNIDNVQDDEGYITGLGPELTVDDFTITDAELQEAKESGEYDGKTDEEIIAALKEKKLEQAKADRLLTIDQIKTEGIDGSNLLVINNTVDSAYYYASTGYTLTAENAYKITVRVFTHNIGHVDKNGNFTKSDDTGAYVELYLGSSNDSDAPLRFEKVQSESGWTTYTFYVLAPDNDVTSVAVRLGLGLYDADDESKLASGYAFFDAVTIEKIGDIADYEKALDEIAEGDTTVLSREIPEEGSEGETGDGEDGTVETPDTSFDLNNLWWMIPTILLALATIAVVVVFFVRKYKKKLTKGAGKDVLTDNTSMNNVYKKKDDYDSYNE